MGSAVPRFLSAKQQASTGIAPVCERFIPQVESVLYSQLLGFTVSGCSQHHQFKIGMPTRDGTHDVVQNQGSASMAWYSAPWGLTQVTWCHERERYHQARQLEQCTRSTSSCPPSAMARRPKPCLSGYET